MFTQLQDPKNPETFKKLFGAEKNKDILVSFLNDFVTQNKRPMINDVTKVSDSSTSIDILCKDEDGNRYLVALQISNEASENEFPSRIQKEKEDQDLKEVLFLELVDFIMFPKSESYKSEHVIVEQENYNSETKSLSFVFYELPKFNKKLDELTTTTEKWMYFFKHAHESSLEDLLSLIGRDWIFEKACSELMNTEEKSVLKKRVSVM